MKEIQIQGKPIIGKNLPTYIIAEMSANHAGKLENALEIVRQAKRSGADCVKIQTYTADTITINSNKDEFIVKGGLWDGYKLYDLYKEAYTPWEWHEAIKEECEKQNIDFLSTPFDKSAVDFLEKIGIGFYKIASYELVDIPLISYAAEKGKPMILSCGMASQQEIQEAVEACYMKKNEQIVLLKCCSEYPAVLEDMNLATIAYMEEQFHLPIGLSDHSEGYMTDVIAVAAGAQVIEKHVCLDKSVKSADSGFSMEMAEFAKMVEMVRKTERIMGNPTYELSQKEKNGLATRRSLYVVNNMKKGENFTEKNVRSIRPACGLEPKYLYDVYGKKASEDIEEGSALTWEMVMEQEES